MASGQSLGWRDPPPEDLSKEVYDTLFPPRPERPKPRTLYDDLPEGLTEVDNPIIGLKKPEPLELYKPRQPDELVPAMTRLWRVSLNDLAHLGWLIERLMVRSPHIQPHMWQGTLMSYMADNAYFFQRSERAVGLARLTSGPFHPTYVEPLFLLHQDLGTEGGSQRNSQGEKDAVAITRAMREWGRHQGATQMRRLNYFSDLSPSVFVNDLKAERREDVWLMIR